MRYARDFGRFWYDFIVGDDWRLAVGVIAIVLVVAATVHDGMNAWWLVPLGVAIVLSLSVALAARNTRRTRLRGR